MDCAAAEEWLDAITGRGWKLDLTRIEAALALLGRPQKAWRAVHVAGTNGKGSTCAFVEAVLLAAGVPCGRYTSPHVVRIEERIRVHGRDCAGADLARWLSTVRDATEAGGLAVTYFEALTAAGFLAFAEARVAVGVVEVGLGGRLDATSTCEPDVCVITSIGLDHTHILGATPAAIAREKAGILRPGVPVVTAARGEALDVILAEARRLGAPALVLGRDFDRPAAAWPVNLPGGHQADNAACAVAACRILGERGMPIGDDHLAAGLSSARIRGRLERIPGPPGAPEVWVDCAHNIDGATALAAEARARWAGRRIHLVFGCLTDRDPDVLLAALPADRLTVVSVKAGPRSRSGDDLLPAARRRSADASSAEDPVDAVRACILAARPSDIVLVAGSIYLAGEVLGAADGGEFWPRAMAGATLP